MATTNTFYIKPQDSRTITNPVLGSEVVFLQTSRESNGRHTVIDMTLRTKGGSPFHCHAVYSKEILCLVGELSVQIGNQVTRLLPGESIRVAAHQKHRFVNHSNVSCRLRCRITPGFPGFEQSLQIMYGLAQAGKTNARGIPKNVFERSYLMMISGTCLPNWMAILQPALPWLGKQAIYNGVAAALQRRYFTIW